MVNESSQVGTFRAELQRQGKDFICQTTLPALSATITFVGAFQGQAVIWQMTLATLSQWQKKGSEDNSATENAIFNHPFIEIAKSEEGIFNIQVGLDLTVIDEPVIKKTIIMIRNYKRLEIGRSGFGSMYT